MTEKSLRFVAKYCCVNMAYHDYISPDVNERGELVLTPVIFVWCAVGCTWSLRLTGSERDRYLAAFAEGFPGGG